MASEITGPEREALGRLQEALASGNAETVARAERAVVDAARSTGAAEVWEAWAFLSADTAAAVNVALKREREAITRRLEALYTDPNASWDDILTVAREPAPEGGEAQAP